MAQRTRMYDWFCVQIWAAFQFILLIIYSKIHSFYTRWGLDFLSNNLWLERNMNFYFNVTDQRINVTKTISLINKIIVSCSFIKGTYTSLSSYGLLEDKKRPQQHDMLCFESSVVTLCYCSESLKFECLLSQGLLKLQLVKNSSVVNCFYSPNIVTLVLQVTKHSQL